MLGNSPLAGRPLAGEPVNESPTNALGGAVSLDAVAPSGGMGVVSGRIRLLGGGDEWRNKAGVLLANKTATVDVHSAATGAQMARVMAATDSAGYLPEISHAGLGQSTLYRVDVMFATGEYGVVYRVSEAV